MGVLRWKIDGEILLKRKRKLQPRESALSAEKRQIWKSSSDTAAPAAEVRRQEWTPQLLR
jgi:ribosomal protein S30